MTRMPRLRLSAQTLAQVPLSVARPAYHRDTLEAGIIHLGIGAFHRAHMAVMTDTALAGGDTRWGIIGASLRSPDTHTALAPQDGLYTTAERDATGERLRVIGSVLGVMVAPKKPQNLLSLLAYPGTRIVSLTITEKGYCIDPATGDLDTTHPDIVHDLANRGRPRSALGFLTRALAVRRQASLKPFTILSCDNLHANGQTLKRVLTQYAGIGNPELGRYIADRVVCPSTMVDRIVPATTDIDRARIARGLGVHDAWPVVMEPFCQWVIEDTFPMGRPDWAMAGAEFATDVAPYEAMKLRLLNASHSAIAYLGAIAGYQTVAQAMADPGLAGFVAEMMDREISPTLSVPAGYDVAAYKRALLQRFRNPALQHRTQQIAMDGSQKLPPRLLGSIRDCIANGRPHPRLTTAVAAWMRYLVGRDVAGIGYDVRDPMADALAACTRAADGDAGRLVAGLLSIRSIFGDDLSRHDGFRQALKTEVAAMLPTGAPARFNA
jgi:fructuronate reductase